MNPVQPPAHRLPLLPFTVAAVAIAFRLWTSFCFFPLAEWNSVRLAPTFMLCFGSTPYPGIEAGPLTTWIYGPVTLLLNLPAVLAHDTVAALFIAGIITLLCAVVPAALTVVAIAASRPDTTRADCGWSLLLCLVLWPNPSLHYIQADNTAVAFGLLANALLARARGNSGVLLVLAGLCTALAVWSKQTAIGLVVAQLVWIGIVAGLGRAIRYALVFAALGLSLGAIFVAWFGFDGLWLNLVRIPGRLPFSGGLYSRTLDFAPELAAYVLLPAAGLITARHTVWKRSSPWLLPALTWICLLPTALLSAFKVGGATNSLNGFLYLVPPCALAVAVGLRRSTRRASPTWLAAGILAILTQQLASAPLVPLRPLTAHLDEAEQLAQKSRGRIYFPWNPLVTFFSDHRFYHAEDGLHTRELAQIERASDLMKRDLPPLWSLTAIPGWREQGSFRQLQPPTARRVFFRTWSVYTWQPVRDPTRPQ